MAESIPSIEQFHSSTALLIHLQCCLSQYIAEKMTLEDNTEIVHSERLENGEVKVYIETPDAKDCFHSSYRSHLDQACPVTQAVILNCLRQWTA